MPQTNAFHEFEHAGYRWLAAPEFVEIAKRDGRVLSEEGSRLVKSGPARRVWTFEPEGLGARVYVKRYLVAEMRDRLKYSVQRSKAAREFRAIVELARRGVDVPEPLALGVRRRGFSLIDSILVTREVGGVPVERYVMEHVEAAEHALVSAFTWEFARFLRRAHDAGLLHRDFHAANILVTDAGPRPRFHFVDLADVRIAEPVSYGERIDNLAVLGRFFCQVAPRHWRLRFLRDYLIGDEALAATARLIESAARRGMWRVWSKRDRRVCGNNKYFHHVMAGRFSGRARREPQAAAALKLFADGDPFDRAEAILKDSRSSTVGVFAVKTHDAVSRIVIKRRHVRRDWRAAFDPARSSRSMRGFVHAVAFENRHLPTPHALAAVEDRRFGYLGASYLVQEFAPGVETLADAMASGAESPAGRLIERDRRLFLRRLARVLRRMHWTGFSMRDLKSANLLLQPREDGTVGILVNDLDAARLYRGSVPEKRAMQNIARLYFDAAWLGAVTRREAVYFLGEYLGRTDRKRTARWVGAIARFVREKRRTFKPRGVFATRRVEA